MIQTAKLIDIRGFVKQPTSLSITSRGVQRLQLAKVNLLTNYMIKRQEIDTKVDV